MEAAKPALSGFFLTNENTNEQLTLFNGAVFGRTQGDSTFPTDPRMSSKHARFTVDGADVFVEDLGARNGVFINGRQLEAGKPARIYPGDMIAMGNTTFCLGRLAGTPLSAAINTTKEDTQTAVVGRKAHAAPSESKKFPTLLKPDTIPHEPSFNSSAAAIASQAALGKPSHLKLASVPSLPMPAADHVLERLNSIILWVITLSMAGVYAMLAFSSPDSLMPAQTELLKMGANYGPLTTDHQWWRVLTSAFVHSSLLHLCINQLMLWHTGFVLTRATGGFGLISIFAVSHAVVNLAAVSIQPGVVFVGAGAGVLGCLGATVASFFADRELKDDSNPGLLAMAALVYFSANLRTSLQTPADMLFLILAFSLGFGLRFAVATQKNFDLSAVWIQILRPLAVSAVGIGAVYFFASQLPKVTEPTEVLTSIIERAAPIAKSYDLLKTNLSGGKLKTEEAFKQIERDQLPQLRALEKELASVPNFADDRHLALSSLRVSIRHWIESLELQAEGLTRNDALILARSQKSEELGLMNLAKTTDRLKQWNAKSQYEIKPVQ